MAVSQIIGASIADGTIAAIDITDGTITTAKLSATTGSGNVVLSAAPTLTGNTSLVNLTVSGTQTNSTLTSGRVRYSTTGGVLTDSSNLQFDGSNLGIGVTPSAWDTLTAFQIKNGSVYGYSTSDVSIGVNNYYGTSNFRYITSSVAAAKYTISGSEHAWYTAPSGTAGNAITFTQAMTLDASGYLGIGTTSPSSYGGLAVRKAVTVSNVPVSASFSDSANSTFDIRHSENIVNLSAQSSGITINTGNSTRVAITDAGLVGIGTTSPADGLNIGTGKKFRATHSANVYQQIFSSASGNFLNAYGDNFELNADSGAIYLTVTAAQPMVFQTTNTERMRISAAGLVGIGTISPTFLTEIVGGTTTVETTLFQIRSNAGGIGTGSTIAFGNSTNPTAGSGRVELAALRTTSSGASFVIRAGDDSGTIQERMRIDSSGNVGIGNTPSGKLDVTSGDGTTAANGFFVRGGTGVFALWPHYDATLGCLINSFNSALSAYKPMTFQASSFAWNPNGTEKMRIDSSGKLLVGCTNDNGGLVQLQKAGSNSVGSGEHISFRLNDGGNYATMRLSTSGNLCFDMYGAGWFERMRITSAGLVGIGTSSPSSVLDVAGVISLQGTTLPSAGTARIFSRSSDSGTYIQNATGGTFYLLDGSQNTMYSVSPTSHLWAISNSTKMTLDSSGNLGLGVTPSAFASGQVVLQNKGGYLGAGSTNELYLSQNVFYGGSPANDRYVNTDFATSFGQSSGSFIWRTAPSGTAGNVITFTEAMRITNAGAVGIGTNSPAVKLEVVSGAETLRLSRSTSGSVYLGFAQGGTRKAYLESNNADVNLFAEAASSNMIFGTVGTERARIDSSGNVGIGTSSPQATLQVTSSSFPVLKVADNLGGGAVALGDSTISGNYVGIWRGAANSISGGGFLNVQGNGIAFMSSNNVFGSGTERMRIDSSGNLLVGKTVNDTTTNGCNISASGRGSFSSNGQAVGDFNRTGDDGTIINFLQDGTIEGTISVSGSTVSYNGGHLSRWSQWQNQSGQPDIYRGTVLESTNDMCEWGQINEQSTKTIVSTTTKSKAVAGVFDMYDFDDKTNPNDFYVAQSGDFVIRIAQGVVVENGDLLESAGDGTARPQTDDICRSSTIAKVTSNYVSTTYADNSFCVPCILMIG